jgi:hypothetical protein
MASRCDGRSGRNESLPSRRSKPSRGPAVASVATTAIRKIALALKPFAFDRLYSAFADQVVKTDAKAAVERSAGRYLRMIGT